MNHYTALPPQERTVLDHLIERGSITNMEAHTVHRIRSVSRRISSLTRAGVGIRKDRKVDPAGQPYVRYTLVSVPAELSISRSEFLQRRAARTEPAQYDLAV